MSQVYKTPQAQRDLVAIGYYLAEHSPVASDRFLREAERAFRLLAQAQELAGQVESWADFVNALFDAEHGLDVLAIGADQVTRKPSCLQPTIYG